MRILATVTLTLALAMAAGAQTARLEAGVSLSAAHDLGFENPIAGVVVGGQFRAGDYAFDGSLSYLFRAHKYIGDGSQVAATAFYRRYFNAFFATAGLSVRYQVTSQWRKTSTCPAVGGGFTTPLLGLTDTFRALYLTPDLTSGNRIGGLRLENEWLAPLRHKGYYVAVKPWLDFDRFDQPGRGRLSAQGGGVTASFGLIR